MPTNTLPEILHPLMLAPSIKLNRCAICGRPSPLEQHHIVRRGAGKLFDRGREVKKPTITLCGFGNNLKDANERYYCHGLTHHNMLHFRWVPELRKTGDGYSDYFFQTGHLEYLICDKPTKYEVALMLPGWKPLPHWRDC